MTRAAVLEAPRRLAVAERAAQAPGRGEARVRIAATAVCHTDLEIYTGRHPNVRYPVVMGHEASGVVDAVGPGVTRLRPGQRVVINPIIACGTCDCCARGQGNLCRRAGLMGRELPGSIAEHVVLAEGCLHPFPEHLSPVTATLIETLATVRHAQERAHVAAGDSVVVLGQGAAGLLHTQLARLSGAAPVIAVSRSTGKLRDVSARSRPRGLRPLRARSPVHSENRHRSGRMSDLISLSDAGAATAGLVGPKAATLARLRHAGLSVPDAVCLTADAYRARVTAAGVDVAAAGVAEAELFEGRKLALTVRLALLRGPLDPARAQSITAAYARLTTPNGLVAVRSSALCEDTADASFAGQFDTFLGIANETELFTAIHACWASLWSSRALRYMRAHAIDPARTAMAVLIQRMVDAEAAGGALSQTPDDELVITGTWGLGSVIAQGEVVPDRFVLRRDGALDRVEAGRKDRLVAASAGEGPLPRAVPRHRVSPSANRSSWDASCWPRRRRWARRSRSSGPRTRAGSTCSRRVRSAWRPRIRTTSRGSGTPGRAVSRPAWGGAPDRRAWCSTSTISST